MELINPKYYKNKPSEVGLKLLESSGFPSKYFNRECIEFIEGYRLSFHFGNAYKYVYRCGEKADIADDLGKALWYLNRFFDSLPVPNPCDGFGLFINLRNEITNYLGQNKCS